jgi:hypothetical protein
MLYVVTYRGPFGFIKPWTAVRDGETFSQQFLTPSIIEGIEKKLFPELLFTPGIYKIRRHKLAYQAMTEQQEVTQARAWSGTRKKHERIRSIITRGVLLYPVLRLAFSNRQDADIAVRQHVCLCRNEDVLLPDAEVREMDEVNFSQLKGFELRFGPSAGSFLVGFNRFHEGKPMQGWIEYNGMSLTK